MPKPSVPCHARMSSEKTPSRTDLSHRPLPLAPARAAPQVQFAQTAVVEHAEPGDLAITADIPLGGPPGG
jgi:hypothetical protein